MNKVITVLAAAFALLPAFAQANVKCPDAKVQMLYPTEEKTFIQLEGQNWQVLGFVGDDDLPTKMAIAQRAKQQNQPVELTFKNGHDRECLSGHGVKSCTEIKRVRSKLNNWISNIKWKIE